MLTRSLLPTRLQLILRLTPTAYHPDGQLLWKTTLNLAMPVMFYAESAQPHASQLLHAFSVVTLASFRNTLHCATECHHAFSGMQPACCIWRVAPPTASGSGHSIQQSCFLSIPTTFKPKLLFLYLQCIQDALDLIEFVSGPAESEWGSLRAKMGHPQPWQLNYFAIGNEVSSSTLLQCGLLYTACLHSAAVYFTCHEQ